MYNSRVENGNMFLYINYINNQEFIINSRMLDFLMVEWNKDDSIIFGKYNKLYSKEGDMSK